jgi:hypothetical protein
VPFVLVAMFGAYREPTPLRGRSPDREAEAHCGVTPGGAPLVGA